MNGELGAMRFIDEAPRTSTASDPSWEPSVRDRYCEEVPLAISAELLTVYQPSGVTLIMQGSRTMIL